MGKRQLGISFGLFTGAGVKRGIGDPRVLRRLSLFMTSLAALAALLAVYGISTARPGMAVIGLPLTLYFAFLARFISPRHVERWDPKVVGRLQDRFFSRLGIRWLTGRQAPGDDNPAPGDRD